jgi:hypothetical protein
MILGVIVLTSDQVDLAQDAMALSIMIVERSTGFGFFNAALKVFFRPRSESPS